MFINFLSKQLTIMTKFKAIILVIIAICSVTIFVFFNKQNKQIQQLQQLTEHQQQIIQHQNLLIIHQNTLMDDLANTLWDEYNDDLPQLDGDTQDKILEETEIIDSLQKVTFN